MRALGMGFLQPVDQMAFMVGLAEIDLHMGAIGRILHPPGNVVQRVIAVNVRLARAEHVEIGSVQHIDFARVGQGQSPF